MKKILGITIALTAIGVAMRARDKKQYITSFENNHTGKNVTVTSTGIISTQ